MWSMKGLGLTGDVGSSLAKASGTNAAWFMNFMNNVEHARA